MSAKKKAAEGDGQDVFRGACLLQIETEVWTPRRRVPKAVVQARLDAMRADPAQRAVVDAKLLEETKFLVDPVECRELNRLRNKAHTTVYGMAVPFPISGCNLIAKELVEEADGKLVGIRDEIRSAGRELARRLPTLAESARLVLEPAGLWDPEEYPEDLAQECDVRWRFFKLGSVDEDIAQIAPAVHRAERARLEGMYAQAREMATAVLRKEFGERLRHVVDRLAPPAGGERRRFNDSMVDGFREWFDLFRARNVWGDADLAELVDRAKASLGDSPADAFRDDADLAARVAGDMARVEQALVAGTVGKGRRVSARRSPPAPVVTIPEEALR